MEHDGHWIDDVIAQATTTSAWRATNINKRGKENGADHQSMDCQR